MSSADETKAEYSDEGAEKRGRPHAFGRRDLLRGGLLTGGMLAFGGLATACTSEPNGQSRTGGGKSTPRRGGTLKVGFVGGGAKETINPALANLAIDQARAFQAYEGLTTYDPDGRVINELAAEITPNEDATAWTIRLVEAEFHNGRPLTAEDAIYSLRYHIDPKTASAGASQLTSLDPRGIEKVDDRTLRVALKVPNAFLDQNLSDPHIKIFPAGMTNFSKPVGTGPFRFDEWRPGESATYNRFENYRTSEIPYLDRVEILSMASDQAELNALVSGQINAAASIPSTGVSMIKGQNNLQLLETASQFFIDQCMVTSGSVSGPLGDARVRRALKLLVDREKVVSNALGGHGKIGNDLFSTTDPSYPSDIEQTVYDPDQARSLLKSAGYEDFQLDMWTGPITGGVTSFAQLMSADAAKAGVTLTLRNVPADQYFSGPYMKRNFFSSYSSARAYVPQAALLLGQNSSINETAWQDEEWHALFAQALRTSDRDRANGMLADGQRLLHDRGGYIIPAFPNFLDAAASNVQGLVSSVIRNLGQSDFRRVYLS